MRHEVIILLERDYARAAVFGGFPAAPCPDMVQGAGIHLGIRYPVETKTLLLAPALLVHTRVDADVPFICHRLACEGIEILGNFWADEAMSGCRKWASLARMELLHRLDELLLPSDEPHSPVRAFLRGTPFAIPARRGLRYLELK